MKRQLQSAMGLLMILALAVVVIWLVQQGVNPSPKLLAPVNSPTPPPLAQWTTVRPELTPSLATLQTIVQVATVSPTVEQTDPNSVNQVAISPTVNLNFDTVKIVHSEEITEPSGIAVDWSPDKQLALVAKQVTTAHLVSGNTSSDYWTSINLVDLWVWHQQTNQYLKITDQALTWDWSPNSQAVVYVTPTETKGLMGTLQIYDLKTQATKQFATIDSIENYPGPFWLANGEILYMDKAQFWAARPNSNDRYLANNLGVYRDISSKEFAIADYSYLPDKLSGRLYLSPDETRIAYITSLSTRLGSQLNLSDLNGNNQLKMDNLTIFQAWATDSTFLIYIKSPSQDDLTLRNLWMIDSDGANPTLLLDATEWGQTIEFKHSMMKDRPGIVTFPTLSPDNSFILFGDYEEGGLWLLEIATKRWRKLPHSEDIRQIYSIDWLISNQVSVNRGNLPNLESMLLTLGD